MSLDAELIINALRNHFTELDAKMERLFRAQDAKWNRRFTSSVDAVPVKEAVGELPAAAASPTTSSSAAASTTTSTQIDPVAPGAKEVIAFNSPSRCSTVCRSADARELVPMSTAAATMVTFSDTVSFELAGPNISTRGECIDGRLGASRPRRAPLRQPRPRRPWRAPLRVPRLRRPRRAPPHLTQLRRPRRGRLRMLRLWRPRWAPPRLPRPRRPWRAPRRVPRPRRPRKAPPRPVRLLRRRPPRPSCSPTPAVQRAEHDMSTTSPTTCSTKCLSCNTHMLKSRYIINHIPVYSIGVVLPCVAFTVRGAQKVFIGLGAQNLVPLQPLSVEWVDKRPWPPPLKYCQTLGTDTVQSGVRSWQIVSCGQFYRQQKSPWPPPIQLDMPKNVIQLRTIHWHSFICHTVVVQWVKLLSLVFSCSVGACKIRALNMLGQSVIIGHSCSVMCWQQWILLVQTPLQTCAVGSDSDFARKNISVPCDTTIFTLLSSAGSSFGTERKTKAPVLSEEIPVEMTVLLIPCDQCGGSFSEQDYFVQEFSSDISSTDIWPSGLVTFMWWRQFSMSAGDSKLHLSKCAMLWLHEFYAYELLSFSAKFMSGTIWLLDALSVQGSPAWTPVSQFSWHFLLASYFLVTAIPKVTYLQAQSTLLWLCYTPWDPGGDPYFLDGEGAAGIISGQWMVQFIGVNSLDSVQELLEIFSLQDNAAHHLAIPDALIVARPRAQFMSGNNICQVFVVTWISDLHLFATSVPVQRVVLQCFLFLVQQQHLGDISWVQYLFPGMDVQKQVVLNSVPAAVVDKGLEPLLLNFELVDISPKLPWPPPIQQLMQYVGVQLRPTPWPSFAVHPFVQLVEFVPCYSVVLLIGINWSKISKISNCFVESAYQALEWSSALHLSLQTCVLLHLPECGDYQTGRLLDGSWCYMTCVRLDLSSISSHWTQVQVIGRLYPLPMLNFSWSLLLNRSRTR